MDISKAKQYMLKGIAIVGMMCLHFWGNPQWINGENMYGGVFSSKIYEMAGHFGNVCVPMFAFLTGYSFFAQKAKWKSGRYRLKKAFRFLMEYWVYMALFMIVGLCCGEKFPRLDILLYNMVGLGVGVGTEYICVPFAWYVSFYLSIIILYPFLNKILNCKLPLCLFLLIIFYGLIEWIHIVTQSRLPVVAEFFRKENTLVSVYVGYLLGRYRVLDKLSHIKKTVKKEYYILATAALICACILRCLNPVSFQNFWGIIYTLFIVVFLCLEIPVIADLWWGGEKGPLYILGKYSMGM